ncbi:hypothetical protein HPB48_014241 [Haemaphysalis longicornis]|uniref:Serine/threonine-protein phosphatase n=1 Tax=Haemaphysalis longicornis TaxID=44386 RepID=A0A9J6FKP1_HAELO|nr:hypothetical protein HPB48_014241 [Haemaphysalis longicornis]
MPPEPSPAAASRASAEGTAEGGLNVDSVISGLLEVRRGAAMRLTEQEMRDLCLKSRELFLSQPVLLELVAPFKILGDIHGQYLDLLELFDVGGSPEESCYLFLGDYVDRGKQSLETMCLLLAYKLKYPENFFLLRGNHECAAISRVYGFYDECKRRYSVKLWKTFVDCFDCLPLAAIIEDKIFCCHGGLSPDLESMEQIKSIARPTDIPNKGLVCDLLWSDPDKNIQGWGKSVRGVSYSFGSDVVSKFLSKHNFDLICRAHQVVEDGYEFFGNQQLVTVFSAPNYCGTFRNAGAMMCVDESLTCNFQILPRARAGHSDLGRVCCPSERTSDPGESWAADSVSQRQCERGEGGGEMKRARDAAERSMAAVYGIARRLLRQGPPGSACYHFCR